MFDEDLTAGEYERRLRARRLIGRVIGIGLLGGVAVLLVAMCREDLREQPPSDVGDIPAGV
jgi:hypothetical protein